MSAKWRMLGLAAALAAGLCSVGCVSWPTDWPASEPRTAPDVAPLVATMRAKIAVADDRASLDAALAACDAVLAADPTHYEALIESANKRLLMGAAYRTGRGARKRLYREAMQLSERAMFWRNEAFRRRVLAGETVWAASDALAESELQAMLFWSTAILYYFKEVMTLPQKIYYREWIQHAAVVLKRCETIDPNWGGGAVQFNLSICYFVLPKAAGGDPEQSRAYAERSATVGADWLLPRWGRAKYFRVVMGDRAGFRDDLEWVLAQDPAATGDDPAWKVFARSDARQMLDDIDRYF